MAEAYSDYVTEWHGGKTRAYVSGWIQSETDKTATIYVYGCANAWQISQYGVRTTVYIDGTEVDTAVDNIFSASGSADVAECEGTLTIDKLSYGQSISIEATISGESYNGYGPIGGSATAYETVWVGARVLRPPSAPSALSGKREANANISLSWQANGANATSTFVERMKKGGSWEAIAEKPGALVSFSDSPGIGSFKYRVRYGNADGYSGYSNETGYILTLCAPAAPTLLSPPSGSVVDANDGSALLKWRHNAIDSSAQTAAEVSWSLDNASFESATVGAGQSYRLPLPENAAIYWKVRTKGAHPDYGQASGVSHFLVRTAPVAVLHVAPRIESLPISVSWDYEDATGRQASAVLEIMAQDGATVFRKGLTTERACEIAAGEFTPANRQTCTVRLTVTSTTSLSYETQATFRTEYVSPPKPSLAIATETGKAANIITVFAGQGVKGVPATATISLFRDNALIAENLAPGQSFRDEMPPLDCRVEYRAVAYAAHGTAAEKTEAAVVRSGGFAFFNYGGKVAKVGMNISIKDKTEGEKEVYSVASSKYGKVFYGDHAERSGTIDADVFWERDAFGHGPCAMLSAIEGLKEHNGLVYLRLPYSDAFMADVDVSIGKSADTYNVASVSIDWRRAT